MLEGFTPLVYAIKNRTDESIRLEKEKEMPNDVLIGTKKDVRHFEVVCDSCKTLFYLDQRMPSGFYQFNIQRYGKTVILRFACSDCPFCMFDEDILSHKD